MEAQYLIQYSIILTRLYQLSSRFHILHILLLLFSTLLFRILLIFMSLLVLIDLYESINRLFTLTQNMDPLLDSFFIYILPFYFQRSKSIHFYIMQEGGIFLNLLIFLSRLFVQFYIQHKFSIRYDQPMLIFDAVVKNIVQAAMSLQMLNKQKMLQTSQKKLILIFKTFFDKAITPQIKKFQGSLVEWNKFCSLLFADTLNYNQLQTYVDSLSIWGALTYQRPQILTKKSEGDTIDGPAFNPSKTFGGERNILKNFPYSEDKLQPYQLKRQNQKEQSLRQRTTVTTTNIISNLQKLLKGLEQNQNIIDNLGKDSQPQVNRNTRQMSYQSSAILPSSMTNTSNNNQNGINGLNGQSYNYISQAHNSGLLTGGIGHQAQSHSQPHSVQSNLPYSVPHPSSNYLKNYH